MSHHTYLEYISQFFLDKQEFEIFCASIHKTLPKTLTCIQSRNSPTDTIQGLQAQGFSSKVSDYNNYNYSILNTEGETTDGKPDLPLGKTTEHLLGYMYIQETAASLPASILPLPKDGHILDMCSAPGGKTIQLADRCKISGNTSIIRANDPDSKRLTALASNITRTGMENIVITNYNGEQIGNILPTYFDAVLLDAPCSGEGTGFKSDFGTKYRDIKKVQSIARVQQQLLISAYKACKPGGYILYSTCTTNPIENEINIAQFLATYPGELELEHIHIHGLSSGIPRALLHLGPDLQMTEQDLQCMKRLRPHIQHTGGFFMCLLRKKVTNETQNSSIDSIHPKQKNHHTKPKFSITHQHEIRSRLREQFQIEVPDHYGFVASKDKIYLSPSSIVPLIQEIKRDRPGLPIIKGQKKSDRRLLHSAGLIFNFGPAHQFELDDNQIIQHIHQQDIDLQPEIYNDTGSSIDNRYVQLLWRGVKVGIGKIIGNSIKNKFVGVV